MQHWFGHILGLDNASGALYLWWSGIFGDLSIFGGALVLYHKHNCHTRRCWRIGRFQHGEWLVCNRHHPVGAPSAQQVAATPQPLPVREE